MPLLAKLNVSRNKLKYVSGSIARCRYLKQVFLDQNYL
jgi:Leucine-rich repeat (LRR) protein